MPFTKFKIHADDIDLIKNQLKPHDTERFLEYNNGNCWKNTISDYILLNILLNNTTYPVDLTFKISFQNVWPNQKTPTTDAPVVPSVILYYRLHLA